MAAKKKSSPEPVPTVFGNYRCPSEHPLFRGRPCNKWLRAGRGAMALKCPRCGKRTEFSGPNDPIR